MQRVCKTSAEIKANQVRSSPSSTNHDLMAETALHLAALTFYDLEKHSRVSLWFEQPNEAFKHRHLLAVVNEELRQLKG